MRHKIERDVSSAPLNKYETVTEGVDERFLDIGINYMMWWHGEIFNLRKHSQDKAFAIVPSWLWDMHSEIEVPVG